MILTGFREGQAVPLAQIAPSKMALERVLAEVARKNEALKTALRLRVGPISIQPEITPKICVTGVAGSVTLFGRPLEILPKFSRLQSWHDNIAVLLERAHGTRFAFEETRSGVRTHKNFVDHVAYAYARALNKGLAEGPIEVYRDISHEGFVARGQIAVRDTLTRMIRRPGLIVSTASELHADNAYNHLLHAAAESLLRSVRDPGVRSVLLTASEQLPQLATGATVPERLPDRPPLQFSAYSEALEIASAVVQGRSWGIGTAASTAFGYVVGMEALFEKFVEATVRRASSLLSPEFVATSRAQVSAQFALPETAGRRAYFTKPDNIISVKGRTGIIVDAKYKRFLDAETGGAGRPSNADVYQMFASMAAQDCQLALLLYPSNGGLEGEMPIWRTAIGSKKAYVAATAIQVADLDSQNDLAKIDERLAETLKTLLYKVHGPSHALAA